MAFLMKCPACGQDAPWFPGGGVVCGCGHRQMANDRRPATNGEAEEGPTLSVWVAERVNAKERLGG